MHDCVSLQPCMHSFCAGCYSEWMAKSRECPSCRNHVERINKNHIVNNLIEAYYKLHPEKKRSAEDTKELDEKNKITKDMLYNQDGRAHRGRMRRDYDDEDSDYDYSDDTDYDSDGDDLVYIPVVGQQFASALPPPPLQPPTPLPGLLAHDYCGSRGAWACGAASYVAPGRHTVTIPLGKMCGAVTLHPPHHPPYATPGRPYTVTAITSHTGQCMSCRQCPSRTGGVSQCDAATSCGGGGVTSRGYQCDAVTPRHVMCCCCCQLMPDRRQEVPLATGDTSSRPAQTCSVCSRTYCHLYWTCNKPGCRGCLNMFKDTPFDEFVLTGAINDNDFESNVLKDYMRSEGLTVSDVLRQCVGKLDAGVYTCTDTATGTASGSQQQVTSSSVLCYPCALCNLKQLLYQFRRDIPPDQLPGHVTGRPDCWWGRNCRTQRCRPLHARKLNHICEQTKFN